MTAFAIITAIFVILCGAYWVFGPIDKKTENSPIDDGLTLCATMAWIVLSILWTAVLLNSEPAVTVFGYLGVLLLVLLAFFVGCVLCALVMYLITWLFCPSLLH
ncbi:MAG: hypothetical protein J5896_05715 [Alphaproteobacteria bacterium]|nr:hypothetical protein [Alphaproteobacteria bacterium]